MKAHTPNNATRRKWHRLQFRLRTLVAFVVVFGGIFAWVGTNAKRAVDQRDAVRAIQSIGGSVYFAEPTSFVQSSQWLRKCFGDDALLHVDFVSLDYKEPQDEHLVHLRGLTQLATLSLMHTPVTDAGLVHLRGLKQLQTLDLTGTPVTDAGLEHLRGLTRLEYLDLTHTNVTEAGVKDLQKALLNADIRGSDGARVN